VSGRKLRPGDGGRGRSAHRSINKFTSSPYRQQNQLNCEIEGPLAMTVMIVPRLWQAWQCKWSQGSLAHQHVQAEPSPNRLGSPQGDELQLASRSQICSSGGGAVCRQTNRSALSLESSEILIVMRIKISGSTSETWKSLHRRGSSYSMARLHGPQISDARAYHNHLPGRFRTGFKHWERCSASIAFQWRETLHSLRRTGVQSRTPDAYVWMKPDYAPNLV
jgi:hypothetical protein